MGTRILAVEDDERIRTAVKMALEDEGWQVEEAETGEDALEAFARHPSDVVLIDIMIGVFPQMCEALLEQHRAIDTLFAMLIAKTMNAEQPFYPSESGQPWGAIQLGKAAIEAAGGRI